MAPVDRGREEQSHGPLYLCLLPRVDEGQSAGDVRPARACAVAIRRKGSGVSIRQALQRGAVDGTGSRAPREGIGLNRGRRELQDAAL